MGSILLQPTHTAIYFPQLYYTELNYWKLVFHARFLSSLSLCFGYGFNYNATYSNCDTTLSLFVVMGSILLQPHSHCDTTFPMEIVKLYTTQSKSLETYFPCSSPYVGYGFNYNATYSNCDLFFPWNSWNYISHKAAPWKLLFHARFFQLLVAMYQVSTLPCRVTLSWVASPAVT